MAIRTTFEAVVQVLAEPAGGDLAGQVAVGRREDPGVGLEGLGAADALELALLEDAEQLGLAGRGSSPTSSRKIVPPAARSNRPGRGGRRR